MAVVGLFFCLPLLCSGSGGFPDPCHRAGRRRPGVGIASAADFCRAAVQANKFLFARSEIIIARLASGRGAAKRGRHGRLLLAFCPRGGYLGAKKGRLG